jgi:hypothetical protein
MKGFYHVQTAKECLASGNVEEAKDHYLKGGGFYIEAADRLPEDDEEHACMFPPYCLRDFLLRHLIP